MSSVERPQERFDLGGHPFLVSLNNTKYMSFFCIKEKNQTIRFLCLSYAIINCLSFATCVRTRERSRGTYSWNDIQTRRLNIL